MTKIFTLDEARQLLPVLKKLIEDANIDLSSFHEQLRTVNNAYQEAEETLDSAPKPISKERIADLRLRRQEFQESIDALNSVQQQYIERLNYWVDKIIAHGVVLRDLKAGLLDFPAQKESINYFLCWRMGESDILFWHLSNDGFSGRKPLSTLLEYY